MTKSELIEKIKQSTKGTPKTVIDEVINALINEINVNERLYVHGLGTFKHVVRAARTARNPKTGEIIQVPEKQVLTFKASK